MLFRRQICFRICIALSVALYAATSGLCAEPDESIKYLCQGWSNDERQTFYFTSQGSQLLPYEWFVALEQADNERLFRCVSNMDRLGFLSYPKDAQRNQHRLPVGFVKDDRPGSAFNSAKEAYLGKADDGDKYLMSSWIGLTCAACHTAEVRFKQAVFRIDGGPAMADFERLLIELVAALEATHRDDEKMTRFAKRVLAVGGYNETERDALRASIDKFLPKLRQLVIRGRGTTPYGYGRLDAFGAILNEICETSLKLPANHHPADAPASYPVLWDTSKLDWVQWNGSAGSPVARNVGQVLGVFAQSSLTGDEENRFLSTAHIRNIRMLEEVYIAKLRSPVWPEELGKLDGSKVEAGKALYAKTCANCHSVRNQDGHFAVNEKLGPRQFIKTTLIPVDIIGTDSRLADNFVKRTANPGELAPLLRSPFNEMKQVPRGVLLTTAVGKVVERYARENRWDADMAAEARNFRAPFERPPEPWSYKARPLNGIWASAPYLHNGSVPTLYHLLLPANQRPTSFHVGSREFDPNHVGFSWAPSERTFHFRVFDELGRAIIGNSNGGHSGRNFTHVKADDESLREFTEAERWSLIEYLKSLR